MFSALRTLSDAAYSVGSLPSPASSTGATVTTSPTTSNMDVSSIASTPQESPSLLFHMQAEDEDQDFLLPPIDDLIKEDDKKQSKMLPHITDLKIIEQSLDITTANDGWGKIDERWGPLPQPNGWDQPSAKPYSVDDYPVLLPPSSSTSYEESDANGEYEEYEEGQILGGVKILTSDDTWPSPPPSPMEGNDMRPPHRSFSGVDPGADWQYNQFGDLDYYRFLIPDPNLPGRQLLRSKGLNGATCTI
jgi:hypothetical protein